MNATALPPYTYMLLEDIVKCIRNSLILAGKEEKADTVEKFINIFNDICTAFLFLFQVISFTSNCADKLSCTNDANEQMPDL